MFIIILFKKQLMVIDMLENILLLLPELALSFVENTCETADFFLL